MQIKYIILSLIFILTLFNLSQEVASKPSDLNLWPKPKSVTKSCGEITLYGYCNINFKFDVAEITDDTYELINLYEKIIFNRDCPNSTIILNNVQSKLRNLKQFENDEENSSPYELSISVKDLTHQVSNAIADEKYHIELTETGGTIQTDTYVGFVRALETFSQLVSYEQRVPKLMFQKLPIVVDDEPSYYHRGIMIDTARHFLSKDTILKTIDGLMYNKFSVLHWHITDAESFPLELQSFPELTKNAIYRPDQYYSTNEVKEIIKYAKVRGVKIMPEIDSPGHARCWSFPGYEEIAMQCWKYGNGQLDPSQPKTWEVIKGIFTDINNLFPDNIVHFGGDEVQQWCWDERPAIKEWMKTKGLTTYDELESYYKQQLKEVWSNITKANPKSMAFWQNSKLIAASSTDEYVQWWGDSADLQKLKDLENKIILSTHDYAYLDHFDLTWQDVLKFDPIIADIKGTIIGGEATLWSEHNNDDTQEKKLWIRGSAFSERLWNTPAYGESTKGDLVRRLTGMEQRLKARGLKPEPTDKQLCQDDPYYCYPDTTDDDSENC